MEIANPVPIRHGSKPVPQSDTVEIILDLRQMKRESHIHCSIATSDKIWEKVGFKQNLQSYKTFTVKNGNLRESSFYTYFLKLVQENRNKIIRIVSDKYCLEEAGYHFKYGFLVELDLSRKEQDDYKAIDGMVTYLSGKLGEK